MAIPPAASRHVSWTLAAALASGLWALPLPATDSSPRTLVSGDINGDGKIDLTDPISLLAWLFASGPPPVTMDCGMDIPSRRNGDADGNSRIAVTDAVYLLTSLFRGGSPPVPIPCSPPMVHKTEIVNSTLFIVDGLGGSITSLTPPDTLIYDSATGAPINSTDGHQLTLAEFVKVRGSASVGCTSEGTHAVLELSGLVPGGLYTMWLVTFEPPGFNVAGFDAVIGNGALGYRDGSTDWFRADENGVGRFSALNLPGPLSVKGTIAKCWLQEEFEV